jgi:tetratricopeptide (TPR) repeat protein
LDAYRKLDEAISNVHGANDFGLRDSALYFHWGNALYENALHENDDIKRGIAIEGAIAKYLESIKLDRNNFRAYNALGVIYYHEKQLPKAIAEYQKAIEVNPGFADPYYNWGLVLRDLHNPREASDKFKKAMEVDPKYAYAYNYWGLTLATKTGLKKPLTNIGKRSN